MVTSAETRADRATERVPERRIAFINPFGTPAYDDIIRETLIPYAASGTSVDVIHLEGVPANIDYFYPKHLMELAITSNVTLQGSLEQIDRLAYRLLDWGDLRVYRREADGEAATLMYRSATGRPNRGVPSPELARLREQALRDLRTIVIPSTRHDARITEPHPDVQS